MLSEQGYWLPMAQKGRHEESNNHHHHLAVVSMKQASQVGLLFRRSDKDT